MSKFHIFHKTTYYKNWNVAINNVLFPLFLSISKNIVLFCYIFGLRDCSICKNLLFSMLSNLKTASASILPLRKIYFNTFKLTEKFVINVCIVHLCFIRKHIIINVKFQRTSVLESTLLLLVLFKSCSPVDSANFSIFGTAL